MMYIYVSTATGEVVDHWWQVIRALLRNLKLGFIDWQWELVRLSL